MNRITRRLRTWRDDSGQAIVITVFALFFFALLGALSIDVGIYVNDRRDAQNVVDKAALAGALELTLTSGATGSAEATARANEWATRNGIDLSDPNITLNVNVVNTCFSNNDPVPTGVEVTIDREAASVFLGFVPGVTDWNVRALAVACAGRPIQAFGFLPFALSRTGPCFEPDGMGGYRPRLGQRCLIQSEQSSSGSNGQLGFPGSATTCSGGNSSGNVFGNQVGAGVQLTCSIGDVVRANDGQNVGPLSTGLQQRLATDGVCQAAYVSSGGSNLDLAVASLALSAAVDVPLAGPWTTTNARDDLYEVWQYHNDLDRHPAEGLTARDCNPNTPGHQTSPRSVQLVVVHDWANPDGPSAKTYYVRGFARAYIEGCEQNGLFYPNCSQGGGPFNVYIRFIEQLGANSMNLGVVNSYGDIEVFLRR
jgi:Flp pilus assembly protein TadG